MTTFGSLAFIGKTENLVKILLSNSILSVTKFGKYWQSDPLSFTKETPFIDLKDTVDK